MNSTTIRIQRRSRKTSDEKDNGGQIFVDILGVKFIGIFHPTDFCTLQHNC